MQVTLFSHLLTDSSLHAETNRSVCVCVRERERERKRESTEYCSNI